MCNWDTNRTAVTSLEGAERTGTCGRSVPWVDEHKRPRQALSVFARRLTPYFYGTVAPRGGIGGFCASRLGLSFRRTLKRNCPLVSHVDVSRDPVIQSIRAYMELDAPVRRACCKQFVLVGPRRSDYCVCRKILVQSFS